MPTIDTGVQDLVSHATGTAINNIMTGPISSSEIKNVRFDVWLCGISALKGRPGIQWSNDGITWDGAIGIDLGGAGSEYATANGWTYSASYTDIFSLGSPKLFVRFVFLALNTSGSATEGGQCRMLVRTKPLKARTLVIGPMRIHNKAHTSNWVTFVASVPISAADVAEIRGTVELQSTTGDLEAKLSFQTSNQPDVASSWGNDTDIAGASKNDLGTVYGSTFASVSTTQDYLRIIIKVRNNSSGAEIEAARILGRIDLRAP